MKKNIIVVITMLAVSLFASACSTKQTLKPPDLTQLMEVKNISKINVYGPVDKGIISDLNKYLKAKLIIAGYTLNQNSEGLAVDVNMATFSPGNQAVRFIIGFGAGRGSLIYRAKYLNPKGMVLAEMTGQERFTGQEAFTFNSQYGNFANMGGDEIVRGVLVQEAAKHIVELIVDP